MRCIAGRCSLQTACDAGGIGIGGALLPGAQFTGGGIAVDRVPARTGQNNANKLRVLLLAGSFFFASDPDGLWRDACSLDPYWDASVVSAENVQRVPRSGLWCALLHRRADRMRFTDSYVRSVASDIPKNVYCFGHARMRPHDV